MIRAVLDIPFQAIFTVPTFSRLPDQLSKQVMKKVQLCASK